MAAVIPIINSQVGTSAATLYAWSSGTAEVEAIDIFNRLSVPVDIDVYYDNNGTSVYLTKDFTLEAGATWSYRGALPVNSTGRAIKVISDTAASLDVLGRVTEF